MQEIRHAYDRAVGRWCGCDWPTSFGPRQSNLQGLSPNQAHLLAEATSGPEREIWRRAQRWLLQVERDAHEAERLAGQAFKAAESDQMQVALNLIEQACQIENQYRPATVWPPFREALLQKAEASRIKIPTLTDSP